MEEGEAAQQQLEGVDDAEADHSDEGDAAPSAISSSSSPPLPPLKLRNYRPKDASISFIPMPRPSYAADSAWLDAELTSLVESAVAHDNTDVLLSIAPKSLNWDLKRDLAPKLALLKKRTAKALQELRGQRSGQYPLAPHHAHGSAHSAHTASLCDCVHRAEEKVTKQRGEAGGSDSDSDTGG